MADNATRCDVCGALSTDPDWCSACGSELSGDSRSDWLAPGSTLRVRMLPMDTDDDTPLPDPLAIALNSTAPMPALRAPPPAFDPGDTMVDEAPFALLTLTIDDILSDSSRRRVLSAHSLDGRGWRVEQFPDSRDDEDSTSAVLPQYVDIPVAFTVLGGRAVRVHRRVHCTPLAERLQDTPNPSPSTLLQWLRPLLDVLDALHAADYLCLRLSPWSVTFRPDGSVFLRGIPGLYPRRRRAWSVAAVTGYSAPDVYLASEETPADERSDVYSVGAILYYLLSGHDPPVDERTAHLPLIGPRGFDLSASIDVESVVRVACHPARERRPRSAGELRRLLELAVERAESRARPADLALCASAADDTHPGIAKRTVTPVNQDAVFSRVSEDGSLALLAVADGVSTASVGSGDIASSLALRTVADAWEALAQGHDDDVTIGRRIVDDANRAIVERASSELASSPPVRWEDIMGSTLIVAIFRAGRVTLVSVGDSRAWLVGADYGAQLTRDHNLATLAVLDGVRTDVALSQPGANALARCLGNWSERRADGLVPLSPEADIQQFRMLPEERLLLATDGLHDFAARNEHDALDRIMEVIRTCPQPEHAAVELVLLANRGGGGDNIGVALLAATSERLTMERWYAERRSVDDSPFEQTLSRAEPRVGSPQGPDAEGTR
jgi:serine/threonine protein phosphatase PrpC